METLTQRNQEKALIARAQSGDRRAMDRILDGYRGLIEQYVQKYSYVPGYTREDLIQLGRIGACEAIYRYDPGRNCRLSTTLYNRMRRSIGRACLKAVGYTANSQQRRRHIDSPDQYNDKAHVHFSSISLKDPEEVVIQRDSIKRLLDKIEPVCAQAMVYKSQGYSCADIARLMDMKESDVRHRIDAAKRQIARGVE